MSRPGFRLRGLMEVILATAAALAAARWGHSLPSPVRLAVAGGPLYERLYWLINPATAVLGAFGFAGLVVETRAGRRPASYGRGRWTRAIAGAVFAARGLFTAATVAVWAARTSPGKPPTARAGVFLAQWATSLGEILPATILALRVALAIARPPRDPAPDAREWLGRAFGLAAVGWAALYLGLANFNV